MTKLTYKDFTIECDSIDDAIKFADHFCPHDQLEVEVKEDDFIAGKEFELNTPDRDEANARAYLGIKNVRGYGNYHVHVYYEDGKNRIINKNQYLQMLCGALKELKHPLESSEDNIKESSKLQCKNKEEELARTYLGIKDVRRVSSDKVELVSSTDNDVKEITRIIKYVDFERMIDHTLKELKLKKPKDSKNPLMATIGSEHIEIGNPPQPVGEIFNRDMLAPKKKRGRPRKVDKHDDIVTGVSVLTYEEPEDNGKKEDLIMGIDDVAKELSRTKTMLFTEEALRKIFQKAYKPALKIDAKPIYPLTQLDPKMCGKFVFDVGSMLGVKCTLSYKVSKDGFTYILMK